MSSAALGAMQATVVSPTAAASTSSRSKVLLPVDTIRQLKLQTGDVVALSSSTGQDVVVGTVWPSFALDSGTVRLPMIAVSAKALQAGEAVTISPFGSFGSVNNSDTKSSKKPSLAAIVRISVSSADATPGLNSKLDDHERQMLVIFVKENLVELECIQLNQEFSLQFQGELYHITIASLKDVNGGQGEQQMISSSKAISVCLVNRYTEVVVQTKSVESLTRDGGSVTNTFERRTMSDPYARLGGLDRQIQEIKALIEMPLMRPEIFHQYGLRPPKGVLLYGPPGTGKTSLARAVVAATGCSHLTINGPELSSAYHGETESKLRDIFREARQKSPCVVIIDEIDALAPRREGSSGEGANVEGAGEVERRVVAQLLTLLDGMDEESDDEKRLPAEDEATGHEHQGSSRHAHVGLLPRVVVLAATNRPNSIDPALRRPGRIDREIEVGIPSADARGDIIRALIRTVPNNLGDEDIEDLARRTHGYVGADLSALVREAGMRAIRRSFDRQTSLEDGIKAMVLEPKAANGHPDEVLVDDFVAALSTVRPSAMREIFLEPPKVYWSDIAGSHTPNVGGGEGALSSKSVQSQIRELVEWPIKHGDSFRRLGVTPPRGVLLYGPPGCSKTLIARALATESGLNFLAVKGPELFSKYVGESERAIREMFKKARAAAPSIVFFDEIDALCTSREGDGDALNNRIIASLLTEMDGIESLSDVIIVGATNRPQTLDPALLRPGRLDRLVYVGPPDLSARKEIMRKRMEKMAVDLDQMDLDLLAAMTDGCSGAEVVSICQEAGLLAMNEDLDCQSVEQRHFELAAGSVKRRITAQMIQQYERWRDTLVV